MSTPKRATVYFEPAVYHALRARALADPSLPVRTCQRRGARRAGSAGRELSAVDGHKTGRRATYERLVRALKRRRLVRHRARPPRS